jgi:hypothetical protein
MVLISTFPSVEINILDTRKRARSVESSREILDRRNERFLDEFIMSPAIVAQGKLLFTGDDYISCEEKAEKLHKPGPFIYGFLTTKGIFLDSEEAGRFAYRNRQTNRLIIPIRPEDIDILFS